MTYIRELITYKNTFFLNNPVYTCVRNIHLILMYMYKMRQWSSGCSDQTIVTTNNNLKILLQTAKTKASQTLP